MMRPGGRTLFTDERLAIRGQGLRKVKQEIAKKGGWERREQRPNLKRFMVVGM